MTRGDLLRELRGRAAIGGEQPRALTLREASALIGVAYNTLQQWEAGDREPTIELLNKTMDVYGARDDEKLLILRLPRKRAEPSAVAA